MSCSCVTDIHADAMPMSCHRLRGGFMSCHEGTYKLMPTSHSRGRGHGHVPYPSQARVIFWCQNPQNLYLGHPDHSPSTHTYAPTCTPTHPPTQRPTHPPSLPCHVACPQHVTCTSTCHTMFMFMPWHTCSCHDMPCSCACHDMACYVDTMPCSCSGHVMLCYVHVHAMTCHVHVHAMTCHVMFMSWTYMPVIKMMAIWSVVNIWGMWPCIFTMLPRGHHFDNTLMSCSCQLSNLWPFWSVVNIWGVWALNIYTAQKGP